MIKIDENLSGDARFSPLVCAAMREPVGLRVKALRDLLHGVRETDADAQDAWAEYHFPEEGKTRYILLDGPEAGRWYYYENGEN